MSGTAAHLGQTFDRDAYLATAEPPVFIARGGTVVGRVLSWEEWLPLEAALARVASGDLTEAQVLDAFRLVTRTMFPGRRRWWWPFRARDVVWREVRALPFAGQLAAVRSFAERQATIQRGQRLTPAAQSPPPTAGTPSPA